MITIGEYFIEGFRFNIGEIYLFSNTGILNNIPEQLRLHGNSAAYLELHLIRGN